MKGDAQVFSLMDGKGGSRFPAMGAVVLLVVAAIAGCSSPPETAAPAAPSAVVTGTPVTTPPAGSATMALAVTGTPSPALPVGGATTAPATPGPAGTVPETPPPPTAAPPSGPVATPAPSDIVIGDWTFTDNEGMTVVLTFDVAGGFTARVDGSVDATGSWQNAGEREYTVALSGGGSWTYRYDAGSDSLYDIADPGTAFRRG